MAFGKDPALAKEVGSWRQNASHHNARRSPEARKNRGGGGIPFFVNRFMPSTVEPDTVRIIQGRYKVKDVIEVGPGKYDTQDIILPYYMAKEHYDGRTNKSAICSAGPFVDFKDKRDPCYGCNIFWESMERDPITGKRKRGTRMSMRDLYIFTVLDYGKYHKIEQVDGNGQVRRNDSTGEAYYNWTKCTGRGCDACIAKKESKFGHRAQWAMGYTHYKVLLDYDKDVGKSCVTCNGRDTITDVAWLCSHCGEAIIDLSSTTMTQKQIDEVTMAPCKCPQCGNEAFLNEMVDCVNCTASGAEPRRATIFDVDLNVKRVEGREHTNQTVLSVTKHSDPRAIDKTFDELAKPMDLEKTYTPTPLQLQEKLFDYKPTTPPQSQARAYGNQTPPQGGPNYGE